MARSQKSIIAQLASYTDVQLEAWLDNLNNSDEFKVKSGPRKGLRRLKVSDTADMIQQELCRRLNVRHAEQAAEAAGDYDKLWELYLTSGDSLFREAALALKEVSAVETTYDANDLRTKSATYRAAYADGQRDREQSKPMAETWNLSPTKASGYTNGYRDACTAALAGEREHLADVG